MKVGRGAVLAGFVWLAVVVAGTALVWTVISRAGEGVVTTAEPVLGAQGPDRTQSSSPTPSSTRGPRSTPTPSRQPRPSPPDQTRSPTAPPPPSTFSPPSAPSPTPPASVRRTWQGAAGFVSVECNGGAVRLVGAQPNSGHAVEVDDSGPDRVRVEFESGGDDERRTRVEARCAAGTPVFEIDAD